MKMHICGCCMWPHQRRGACTSPAALWRLLLSSAAIWTSGSTVEDAHSRMLHVAAPTARRPGLCLSPHRLRRRSGSALWNLRRPVWLPAQACLGAERGDQVPANTICYGPHVKSVFGKRHRLTRLSQSCESKPEGSRQLICSPGLSCSLLRRQGCSESGVAGRTYFGAADGLDCKRARCAVGSVVCITVICCPLDLDLDKSCRTLADAACGRAHRQVAWTLLEPAQAVWRCILSSACSCPCCCLRG